MSNQIKVVLKNVFAYTLSGSVIIQDAIWFPSGGSLPTVGSTTNTIYKGYQFIAQDSGTVTTSSGSVYVSKGAKATALTDSPGQVLTNWDITF